MGSQVMTRNDRTAGIVLLALSVLMIFLPLFVPHFALAGGPINWWFVDFPWFLAAIALLTGNSAASPSRKLTRWGAAILFVMGLVGPFVAKLIGA
jgi:hypothetical protein